MEDFKKKKEFKVVYNYYEKTLMYIPMDVDDDDDNPVAVVDSVSVKGILPLRDLGVDNGSVSTEGISSIICLGVDVTLIIDGELNIFGGESNVIVGCIISVALNV
jgi:hypothetical protein